MRCRHRRAHSLEEILELMAATQADVQAAADRLNAVNTIVQNLVANQPAALDLTPVTDAAAALEATTASVPPAA